MTPILIRKTFDEEPEFKKELNPTTLKRTPRACPMDDQEVNTIRGQFQAGLWPQFLQMVQIDGLASSGDTIRNCFRVPGTPYLTAWANSGKSGRARRERALRLMAIRQARLEPLALSASGHAEGKRREKGTSLISTVREGKEPQGHARKRLM
jgi:hypothetical protein